MERAQVQYGATRSCRWWGVLVLAQPKSWGERGWRACFWRGRSETLQGKAYLCSSYQKRVLAGKSISSLDQFLTLFLYAIFKEGKLSFSYCCFPFSDQHGGFSNWQPFNRWYSTWAFLFLCCLCPPFLCIILY